MHYLIEQSNILVNGMWKEHKGKQEVCFETYYGAQPTWFCDANGIMKVK